MATQQWKHHVFISFRGEDTRHNFVCHLYDALCHKGLDTFVDNQLRTGEEINPALLQAIHHSKVAIIIFSENYASSSWCLDELLKIIECHESKTHKQIVIPVFYGVTPSDVRRQNGRYGESFAKHIENGWYNNKIQKWKGALTQAANISGWDSGVMREDNKLIDQIVRAVLDQFGHLSPRSLEGFVGLKSKMREVKTLLATGSSDVCMLGIWGMGGIGKTTLAEAIFAEVSIQFEGRCIVEKVREAWENDGNKRLLKQLFSELLEQSDVKIDTTIISPESSLVGRLKRKKVFVVFDDVADQLQLEYLIGKQCWFGAGSKIIVTSRDEQVFKGITDNIYKVEALSYAESHELFVWNAFKQKLPSQDHIPLIDSFVNYAKGNPLAITVLGSSVCGVGVELWEEALTKLSNCPKKEIHDVLKLSYDRLDEEQSAIFLHIACFFKGKNVNEAKRVFQSCGLSANIGVSHLVSKSLVTVSENHVLDMHDLIQEMGRQIVRQESKDDPRGRSRLWDAEEIRHVFEENEGTEAMKTQFIILNTSQIRDVIEIDPNVFKRMPNLKVLRFYTSWGERSKLHLTERLRFLPSGLRYLHWDGYPFESLPAGFHAKQLLVLDLPNSNIKQILKVPPSSRQFFSKITSLDMSFCQNLKSFPNNVDLQCLEILNLEGCLNLKIFPEISTNLRKLNVGYAAIKEVSSSSIKGLNRLEELNMKCCEKLESLPSNICKLQDLQKLDLRCCSRLKKFPEILEPMSKLRRVELSSSGIEAIPSSIDNMKGLEYLGMRQCYNLAYFPESFGNFMRGIDDFKFSTTCDQRKKPTFPTCSVKWTGSYFGVISKLPDCLLLTICNGKYFEPVVFVHAESNWGGKTARHVSECISYLIDLPSHPCLRLSSPCSSFYSLYYILDLSDEATNCSIRELPKNLGSLYYLRELNLSRNSFVEIPASIKQICLLETLRLDSCVIRSLPQLPPSLRRLTAWKCPFLKTLSAFKQPFFNGGKMNLGHSFKLEKNECEAMAYKMLSTGLKVVSLRYTGRKCPSVLYPGSRCPEWFRHQTTGDIIRIKLSSNWLFNRRFFGFAFCVVSDSHLIVKNKKYVEFECYLEDKYNPTIRFTYQTNFNLSPGDDPLAAEAEHVLNFRPCYDYLMHRLTQHVLVWCLRDFNVWISERRHLFGHHCMASFKFFTRGNRGEIKKCGITPLYMQDDHGEDEYDDDENAFWMLQSAFLTEMSTNEDDDEDINS